MTDLPHGSVRETDPVCGRAIDPSTAPFRITFELEEYLFCSQKCLNQFKEDPARYTEESESHERP